MAMTLADKAKLEKNPLRKGIITGLVKTSFLMERLPFENVGNLKIQVVRWKTLPSNAWRKLNAAFSEGTGTVEQLQESLYILGGDIDVEKHIAESSDNITDPRALQTNMRTKAMAYQFNEYFILGDQAVNPDGIDGLKVRIDDLVAAGYTDRKIDAGGLDISTGTAMDSNGHAFLDLVDQLRYAIDEHRPDLLIMNDTVLLKLRSILRRKGLLDTSRDMFGRDIDSYAGVPLLDIGVKVDQTSKIISDSHDGTTGRTSIYAVRFGVEEYLGGLQKGDIDVRDLGELESKPTFRTRVEWVVGISIWNPRAVARLHNIKVA